jgi:hypothetical protein
VRSYGARITRITGEPAIIPATGAVATAQFEQVQLPRLEQAQLPKAANGGGKWGQTTFFSCFVVEKKRGLSPADAQ